ncbi:MAG: ECF transporter S component [Chloroflexi bacterium]|nr:MAG: ECF transporter S component [Chloroflexota bacterium]
MEHRKTDPRRLALIAVMAVIVYLMTRLVQIPTPVKGYIHLGDAGVYFTAFAFGPLVGAAAAGLGTALADLTSGYSQWAIYSLLIHGAQAWVAAQIARRRPGLVGLIAATIAGGLILVPGYLIAGTLLVGFAAAVTEVFPNTIQALSGAVIGIPLYLAVREAYPPLARFGQLRPPQGPGEGS